jgi:hypothetical protein
MANQPVDLKYDTWFPTDWLSANLRHVVSVIFSHATNVGSNQDFSENMDQEGMSSEVAQSTDVEQVSDGKAINMYVEELGDVLILSSYFSVRY